MALLFDATGEKVTVTAGANIDNLDSMTVMVWYYANTLSTSSSYPVLDKGLNPNGWQLFRPAGGTGPDDWWFIHWRNTTDTSFRSGANIIQANRWEWICVMDSDGVTPEMLHGTLSSRATEPTYDASTTGSGAAAGDSSLDLKVGSNDDDTQVFDGKVAIVQVFSRRMSQAEALTHQFNPRVSNGCVLFLNLHGTGTQPDLSGNQNNGTVTNATVTPHVPLASPFSYVGGWEGAFTAPAAVSTSTRRRHIFHR